MCPWRAVFLGGWLAAASPLLPAADGVGDDPVASLEVPVEDGNPMVPPATDEVRATLAEMHLTPPPAVKPGETRSSVSSNGRYVLAGDLFGDGNQHALVDLQPGTADDPGVALAVWHDERWELRGLWKISAVWRPAGWESSDGDYLPVTPATQPFWREDLAGDSAPWMVFTGDTEKYFQEHYVLRFDAVKERLQLLDEAMDKPEFLPGGWLRLYQKSGRRAIFEQWNYRRWDGHSLKPYADWHDETPCNDRNPPFVEATVYGPPGSVPHVYKAEMSGNPGWGQPDYRFTRDGQPFASVTFIRRHPLASIRADETDLETAYLFKRLTGLPSWLYPQGRVEGESIPSRKPGPLLEHSMKVRVRGNAVAVRLLATPLGRGGF